DSLTATKVAESAAERYNSEVIVTPTISISVSAEHRHFPGTLWIKEDTFRAYIRDVVESLSSHGWNRVILVNGHGGNTAALREVSAQLTREETAYTVPFTWFEAIENDSFDMGHAGPIETSVLQFIHPELVDESAIEDASEKASERWGIWVGQTNIAFDVAEFAENGVVGDPKTASAEQGEMLLNQATESLVSLLTKVEELNPERLPDK
ncbi:MAG: creatininase family protein, partial [Halobacteriaceae archaeon]